NRHTGAALKLLACRAASRYQRKGAHRPSITGVVRVLLARDGKGGSTQPHRGDGAMSTMLNDTRDAARNTLESAKERTQHAASSARSAVLDGIRAVSGALSIARGLQLTDMLGWFGLARRRGALESFAVFGAGVAVGAGAGLLFAPMSGADLRRRSEEHTSELQSLTNLVCRLLLEKHT